MQNTRLGSETKSRLDSELMAILERKYGNKVFLSPEEVEKETLVNPTIINSTSDKPNTWLLRDVVEYLNRPFYPKGMRELSKREKRAMTLQSVTGALNKYWEEQPPCEEIRPCHGEFGEIRLSDAVAKAVAMETIENLGEAQNRPFMPDEFQAA
ncbi:MAG: hypothetical protein LBU73_04285 [Helicobacteraceae bacterium]|jgi:hypothetical protein|nr:hypothetical protein [Helicobacteraceae bacterium]